MVIGQMPRPRLSHLFDVLSCRPAVGSRRRTKWIATLICTDNEESSSSDEQDPTAGIPNYEFETASKRDQHTGECGRGALPPNCTLR